MNKKILLECDSPVSVVDISGVLQLDKLENLKLNAPTIPGLPPPVDSITVTTVEDTASVSSLSTGVQEEPEKEEYVPKRCIFSNYWDKTGEKPVRPQSRKASLRRQRAVAGRMDKSLSHFSQPSEGSDVADCSMRTKCSLPQESPQQRRSIFGATLTPSLRSLPTLANADEEATPIPCRKIRSASALQDYPPSCLRNGHSGRRSSSVSFDEKIDVVMFQKPQEQFSEGGWEHMFDA